jgi:asparagine synthase (glutamine-hydrolysing)
MCGINGFYSKTASTFNNVIVNMNSAISHRGPDSDGVWNDKNIGIVLGHQRLSIIDLTKAGHQPMQSHSERFILTYNGEIYNHLEIRNELEKSYSPIKWKGTSDTETLLQAIEFWGIETTLKKIVGMFAFAVWDQKNRCLTLARDRIGEKPIYFGWQGKGENKVFLFGSELKALKVHPGFNGDINRDAIALQLRHNCIPAPYSIYKNINKLLPAHYLQLKENDLKEGILPNSKPYWSLKDTAVSGINSSLPANIKNIKDELEQLLKTCVKQQMISDVSLGAFLSGGVDSSTIVALMQAQSVQPIKTFTIGFHEENYNEAKYAKEVAKHLGTDHTEFYVSDKQALEVIPKLSNIYDEPFSDSSQIPTFLVSELAKQNVKVSLSGDGGDEMFCGYNRYTMSKNWWNKVSLMPWPLRNFLADRITAFSPNTWNKLLKIFLRSNYLGNSGDLMYKFSRVLRCKTLDHAYLKLTSHFDNPTEIVLNSKIQKTRLSNYNSELNQFDNQQKMMIFDALTYLPDDILVKVDRASMANSLEIRTPFLDHRIVEFSWQIPQSLKLKDGQGKWILRQILNKYVPKKITERPKMGFGVPIDIWLRGPLRDWAESLLNETRLKNEGYFDKNHIRTIWKEHLSKKKNWQHHLWDILIFQSWLDKEKNS